MKTGRISTPLERLQWLFSILIDPKFNGADAKVAGLLANTIGVDHEETPISTAQIAEKTGLNRRTIQRSVKSLIDFGCIRPLSTIDGIDHGCNIYRLYTPMTPPRNRKVIHRKAELSTGGAVHRPQGGGLQTAPKANTINTIAMIEGGGRSTDRRENPNHSNEPRARVFTQEDKDQRKKKTGVKKERKLLSKKTTAAPKTKPKPKSKPKPPSKKQWRLPPGIDPAVWQEFEQHRVEIREPMTNLARTKNANILLAIRDPALQRVCVDKTIRNRWVGLFFLKPSDFNSIGSNRETHQPPYRQRYESSNDRANRIHNEWIANDSQTLEPDESHPRPAVRESGGHSASSPRMGVVLDGNFRREKP